MLCYDIRFNNIFLGQALKYGGWGNTEEKRFFKKRIWKIFEDIVHEEVITTKQNAGWKRQNSIIIRISSITHRKIEKYSL